MNNNILTENMKFWLKELYLNEAEEHRVAASNSHMWALGTNVPEAAAQWEGYAEEHREYVRILETMADEIDMD